MPARCLNKVMLIGNLTRDPELRYTPSGSAVCSFGLATNRYWATETGERKEDVQFHRAVAWNKLAEICSQLLGKGDKVYLEGRLQTRQWTGQDGVQRKTTEVVIADMILLRSQRGREGEEVIEGEGLPEKQDKGGEPTEGALKTQAPTEEKAVKVGKKKAKGTKGEAETVDEGEGKGEEKEKKQESKEEETEEAGLEDVEIPEDKTPF